MCYRNIASPYSRYRVSFGNIYNGNKYGRCFYYDKTNGVENVLEAGTYIPDNVVLNNNNVHYYEGNYMYKKKVMPLRYLVAQTQDYTSSFRRDTLINE
jgi:hypothetical protein